MLAHSPVSGFESSELAAELEPVLDLAHLRRYTLDDVLLQHEILGLFRDQVHVSVATLRGACEDQMAWAMAAHTLKGTARAVGAFRLGRAAERAERDAGTPEARMASAELVAKVADETLAEID